MGTKENAKIHKSAPVSPSLFRAKIHIHIILIQVEGVNTVRCRGEATEMGKIFSVLGVCLKATWKSGGGAHEY